MTLFRKPKMTSSKKILSNILVVLLSFLLMSCSGKQKGASIFLKEAQEAYEGRNYALAKLKIDSIKMVYPDAFTEITKGFELMQEVRLAENLRNISYCDSMLEVSYALLNSSLKDFNYVRDPQYQEFGDYIPKILPLNSAFSQNGLRVAVNENGKLYIESVFSGQALRHNKIKVSTKDGAFAESLPVTSDGLNYSFKTLDKTYEIVRYTGTNDNGVANFIYTFKDQPITLTFIGNSQRTVTLPTNTKEAIGISVELSSLILNIEDFKYEKGRSQALIQYLKSKDSK
ncbi:MAG: hypothetical protein GXZ03_04035 [Proteiniphilum sp.]|nr:hypothetical protein [Proteiniphilum sp.]